MTAFNLFIYVVPCIHFKGWIFWSSSGNFWWALKGFGWFMKPHSCLISGAGGGLRSWTDITQKWLKLFSLFSDLLTCPWISVHAPNKKISAEPNRLYGTLSALYMWGKHFPPALLVTWEICFAGVLLTYVVWFFLYKLAAFSRCPLCTALKSWKSNRQLKTENPFNANQITYTVTNPTHKGIRK